MPASRLADRRIREAAAQAALGLDVRGPVSEALGRAGVVVPPADAERPPTSGPASTRPRLRTATSGLAPTPKPFAPAPWPTRGRTAAPKAALSGLTADERRVHRILLDSLDRTVATEKGGLGGMIYAEKKGLETLDLAFINAQLAKMTERQARTAELGRLGLLAALFVAPLALGIALVAGVPAADVVLVFLLGLAVASAGLLGLTATSSAASPRRQIYEALRELALLVDDAPVSDALAQADLLIDRLADDDEAAHAPAPPLSRVRS